MALNPTADRDGQMRSVCSDLIKITEGQARCDGSETTAMWSNSANRTAALSKSLSAAPQSHVKVLRFQWGHMAVTYGEKYTGFMIYNTTVKSCITNVYNCSSFYITQPDLSQNVSKPEAWSLRMLLHGHNWEFFSSWNYIFWYHFLIIFLGMIFIQNKKMLKQMTAHCPVNPYSDINQLVLWVFIWDFHWCWWQ